MNIVTINTKKGFKIQLPVWRIGGLVTKNDPPVDGKASEFYINIIGEETYEVDEVVYRSVSDIYTEWMRTTSLETISVISIAEQVSKNLSDLIKQVGENIREVTDQTGKVLNNTAAAFKETSALQAQLSKQADTNNKETLNTIKDVTEMAKAIMANTEVLLKASDTATNSIVKVAKRLEKVTESLDKIEALNLVN